MREHTIGWIAGSIYFVAILLLDWAGAGMLGVSSFVVAYSLLLFVAIRRFSAANADCEQRNTAGDRPAPC